MAMRPFISGSLLALLAAMLLTALTQSCTIEPPLKLATRDNVEVRIGEVEVTMELVWNIDVDWETRWWYGWDETDLRLWGDLTYPEPSTYELRLFYLGRESAESHYLNVSSYFITEPRFRKSLDFGFHNVLAWSNIDSPEGVQSLVVDESDLDNVYATTSRVQTMSATSAPLANVPEIFYSAYEKGFEISDDPADYDMYLEEENIWIKQLKATLTPRVFIYLVQVVIYNNNGRILGTTDYNVVTGLSAAVQLHTGRTSYNDTNHLLELRMKKDLAARDGRHADIIGGKLTTFGLCSMDGWQMNRSAKYEGSRDELPNSLHVGLRFSNNTDSLYRYDITRQMRDQANGGVITVEIDADTIKVPVSPGGGTPQGGFDPTITPTDSVEHLFPM